VRYSWVGTSGGIAGAQVARALLDARGLQGVQIEWTPGMLSDHYDPQSKTLRLSPEVYYTPSLAAASIAAHETGHALQDAAGYLPLKARSLIVPAVHGFSLPECCLERILWPGQGSSYSGRRPSSP
jgi:uncharacterized protein